MEIPKKIEYFFGLCYTDIKVPEKQMGERCRGSLSASGIMTYEGGYCGEIGYTF